MSEPSFTIPDDISSLTALEGSMPLSRGQIDTVTAASIVGSTYAWADEWAFHQQQGYCCFNAPAFILNQFVGSGIYDADAIMAQAYELGFGLDQAPAASLDEVETFLRINGVDAHVTQSGIVDLTERLRAGWGILVAISLNGTDRLVVVNQINTGNGTLTLIDPQSPESFTYEMDFAEITRLWSENDFSLLATNSINTLLRTDDIIMIGGECAKVALINLTGRSTIR